MTVIGEAFILISPDAKRFEADVTAETKGVGTAVSENIRKELVPGFEKTAKTIGGVIAGALAGSAIRQFVSEGVEGLKAVEVASTQTAAQIRATGGAANVSAEDVSALTREITDMSGVSSRAGVNVLLAFKNIRNEVGETNDIFDQATKAAVDLSVSGFGSVESASRLLGRALNDPIAGLSGLRRINVTFTEAQKELITELTKTGDILGAQKIILEEVTQVVGGAAEAYGDTLAGKQAIAQAAMDRMQRTLSEGMIPALEFTADATVFLGEQFEKQPEIVKQIEGTIVLLAGAVSTVAPPIIAAVEAWQLFKGSAEAAQAASKASAFTNSADAVGELYTSTSRAAGAMKLLGAAAVVAVAAFGIKQLIDFERQLGEIEVNVDNLATALAGIGPDQGELEKFVAVADAAGELDDVVQQTAETNLVAAERLIRFAEANGYATGKIDELRQIVSDEASAQAQANAEREITNDVIGNTAIVADAATVALDGTTGATDEFGEAAADTADEVSEYEQALEDARQAVEDLFDATQSSIDQQFAYRDSLNNSEDALADIDAMVKDGNVFSEEFVRSVDAAEEALYAQSEAAVEATVKQVELAGGTADASAKAQIQVAELKKLRDQVGPESALGKRLQGHIDALNRIPRTKSTTVDVLTGAAMVKLDRLARRINDILRAVNSPIRISTGGGGGIPLAGGGIVPGHYTEAGYFATGGGPRGTDIIPAWLTPGEFVMRKAAVDRLGPGLLEALNGGAFPAVASAPVTIRETPIVQNISTSDPIAAAGEAARRGRAVRLALSLRG